MLIIVFLSIYIAADPDMYHAASCTCSRTTHRERAGEVLSAIAGGAEEMAGHAAHRDGDDRRRDDGGAADLRVKAAFALGLLAGLFEFIPTVGPIISALPAIAMGFLDSPEKALSVTVAYFGIQFVENHLLIPLLMKGGINLPPALTVFSQALMALMFGFLGLMCAVPLLAATVVAVQDAVRRGRRGRSRTSSPVNDKVRSDGAQSDRPARVLPLFKRFPALAQAAARRPRPISDAGAPHAGLSPSLWVKRDDLCADPLGGNKVRALEFLLGGVDARR